MNISMVKLKDSSIPRKRIRDSVTQEHIKYNAKIFGRMGALYSSQYSRVKNQEKWDRVMQYIYPALHESGKAVDCKVEMSLNTEEMTATILYKGKALFLMDDEIADLLVPADMVRLVAHEGEFWLALTYALCDKVLTRDHAQKIQDLKFCRDASGAPKIGI